MTDLNAEFELIRRRYGSEIRAGVRQALGGETDAEDVIIDCELALFTALRDSPGRQPPRSLIYRIIKNKVADYLRQKIKQRQVIAEVERAIREHQSQRASHDLTLGLTLTSAETRVLKLLGVGLSNAEMAQRLSVSKNTIRSHLKKIYRSLGCHDRLKVAIWAFSLSSGKKDPGSD